MSESKNISLSLNEKRDLVIQASMQAIPYVGGSLASLYFGAKQERRFKRIEKFYEELAKEMQYLSSEIAPMDQHNKEALEAIIDELHEKVEAEHAREKREFFKNYFKNTFRHPIKTDFDKRKYFLDTLGEMTLLECELLVSLSTGNEPVSVDNVEKSNTDQYAIVGAIGRLKSYGFLMASQKSFNIGGGFDNTLREQVKVSSFGREFCNFCLSA